MGNGEPISSLASQEIPRILWEMDSHSVPQLVKKFPAFYGKWTAIPFLSYSRNSPHFTGNGQPFSSSASQEIPRILWEIDSHYRNSQHTATCSFPEPDKSSPRSPTLFL